MLLRRWRRCALGQPTPAWSGPLVLVADVCEDTAHLAGSSRGVVFRGHDAVGLGTGRGLACGVDTFVGGGCVFGVAREKEGQHARAYLGEPALVAVGVGEELMEFSKAAAPEAEEVGEWE